MKKSWILLLFLAVALLIPCSAWASHPIDGTWKFTSGSTDMGVLIGTDEGGEDVYATMKGVLDTGSIEPSEFQLRMESIGNSGKYVLVVEDGGSVDYKWKFTEHTLPEWASEYYLGTWGSRLLADIDHLEEKTSDQKEYGHNITQFVGYSIVDIKLSENNSTLTIIKKVGVDGEDDGKFHQNEELTLVRVDGGGVTNYPVTVNSTGTGATGSGSYAPGATVNISAGTPPVGKQFSNWTALGVTLGSPDESNTSFTMPANPVTVTANFADIPAYGISLVPFDNKVFDSATWGYGAQTPHSVTVENAGNQATGELTVALSGANAGSFTLSKTEITNIAADGSDSFTVTPNTGLSPGTYTATVTVSGGNVTSKSFGVSFTVDKANPTVTWPTGATLTYGETLADAEFTGGSGDGAFAFTDSATAPTVAQSGTASQVTFTPTDSVNYNNATHDVNITVNPALITDAAITVTAPATGAIPNASASGAGNFAGSVTWTPGDNPFSGDTQYTATVTLTANVNYAFDTNLTSATINGQTATVTNNNGDTVTLSYQFPATEKITYLVTVSSAGSGSSGGDSYVAGATVNINAGAAPTAQKFVKWTASGVTLGSPNSPNTSFTMPANPVTVTANFILVAIDDGEVNNATPLKDVGEVFDAINTDVLGFKQDDFYLDAVTGNVFLDERIVNTIIAQLIADEDVELTKSHTEFVSLGVVSADVTINGDIAQVRISGLKGTDLGAGSPNEIKLLKVISPDLGELLKYAGTIAEYNDGRFTLLGKDKPLLEDGSMAEVIEPGTHYDLVVFIKDGGKYDLDRVPDGKVIDPLNIVHGASGGGGGSDDAGGGGGCNAGAGMFGALALLSALSVTGLSARRRKKNG